MFHVLSLLALSAKRLYRNMRIFEAARVVPRLLLNLKKDFMLMHSQRIFVPAGAKIAFRSEKRLDGDAQSMNFCTS
jgi:hypothetical protein